MAGERNDEEALVAIGAFALSVMRDLIEMIHNHKGGSEDQKRLVTSLSLLAQVASISSGDDLPGYLQSAIPFAEDVLPEAGVSNREYIDVYNQITAEIVKNVYGHERAGV